jgi:hypothetical protein
VLHESPHALPAHGSAPPAPDTPPLGEPPPETPPLDEPPPETPPFGEPPVPVSPASPAEVSPSPSWDVDSPPHAPAKTNTTSTASTLLTSGSLLPAVAGTMTRTAAPTAPSSSAFERLGTFFRPKWSSRGHVSPLVI